MLPRTLIGIATVAMAAAACSSDASIAPDVTAAEDVAHGGTCSWTPVGPVSIPEGDRENFTAPGGCSGYGVTINPGSANFGVNASCSQKSTTTLGAFGTFSVFGCAEDGTASVEIRDGSTLVQTITVDALP